MPAKGEDRRVQRTRALLLSALLDLIAEKGYEDVTVQDIVDRANVGRSTFYAHFLDKRELLLTGLDSLHEFLIQQQSTRDLGAKPRERLLRFSLVLFEHVQSNIQFCRALLGTQSGAIVEPRIKQILGDFVGRDIDGCISPGRALALPRDVIVQFTVSAYLGMLRWWMDQPVPCSPEQIDRQFRALAVPALMAVLGEQPIATCS